jgi:triacylglycerol lipase
MLTLDSSDAPAAVLNNATYLAAASSFAYWDEDKGREEFKAHLDLDARLISVNNTQVFVAKNDTAIVAAFRGTESPTTLDGLKDCLLTDANDMLILPEGRIGTDFAAAGVGARYHRGFMTALADIWDPMFSAIDGEMKKKERLLWLTGHSLGGALALLAAWRFLQNFITVFRIYTFGAPMVGNPVAVQAFDKEFKDLVFRFVHEPDPVPHLPTVSLMANSYGHCLQEMLLQAADTEAQALGSAREAFRQLAGGHVGGLLDGSAIETVWNSVLARAGAHGIENYRTLIANKCKD